MESQDKLTVSIDSQWLETLQACHRKMKLKFVDNLRQIKTAEALEKGSLLHEILDAYYTEWERPYNDRVANAVDVGRKFLIKQSLPMDAGADVIYQFKEYAEHYRMDGWKPCVSADGKPMVEQRFSIILHEDDEIKIIYSGKVDLVADTPIGVIVVDHKSESRKSDPSMLTNQFIGYANALGIYNVWVNKIGFQKTLSRADRFRRYLLAYNPAWVEEWKHNIIPDIKRAALALQNNDCRPNFTACDRSYFGCEFKPLCETTEDNRIFKARTFFKVGEPWDPYHTKKDD